MIRPSKDEIELWRPVPFFDRYEVSSFGNVRKWVASRGGWRMMKLSKGVGGYLTVSITSSSGPRNFFVHQLVCRAFHGARLSEKHEVAHCDGVRNNNYFRNLRWATRTENMSDKWRHGTRQTKLTPDQVYNIRSIANRQNKRHLAKAYGVSYGTICTIVSGRAWRDTLSETSKSDMNGALDELGVRKLLDPFMAARG